LKDLLRRVLREKAATPLRPQAPPPTVDSRDRLYGHAMIAKFEVNQKREAETLKEFVERSKLSPTELTWVESQPVLGDPSLRRLRTALGDAGLLLASWD
jgi:hypothetical protein